MPITIVAFVVILVLMWRCAYAVVRAFSCTVFQKEKYTFSIHFPYGWGPIRPAHTGVHGPPVLPTGQPRRHRPASSGFGVLRVPTIPIPAVAGFGVFRSGSGLLARPLMPDPRNPAHRTWQAGQ